MARILFFHYRQAKRGKPVLRALQDAGHQVWEAAPEFPDFKPTLEVARPEAVVADCTERYHHVVESVDYLVSTKAYRDVPVVLTNLEAGSAGYVRSKLPRAVIVAPDEVVDAVVQALG